MKTLTFYEYDGFLLENGSLSTKISDIPLEQSIIEKFVESISQDENPLSKIFSLRGYHVKATHFVGAIRFENIQLIILPKISKSSSNTFRMENINFMLEKAFNIKAQANDVTELNTADGDFIEYQIRHFANRLSYEIKRGMNREFTTEESEKKFLKGKLNFPKTLRMSLKGRNSFVTKSFVFTEDNALNQILKWTCRELRKSTKNDNVKSQLQYCSDSFAEVSDIVPTTSHFSKLLFNRSNERYEDLVNLSRLVFEGEQIVLETGVNRINGLIFDMNKLFEGFIATALKETLPAVVSMNEQTEYTYAIDASGRQVVKIKPDIVVSFGNTLIVMDTKYKIVSAQGETVSNADVYQISAYRQYFSKHYKIVKAVLIYPEYDSEINTNFENGHGEDEFEVITVSLSGNLKANYPEMSLRLYNKISKVFQESLGPITETRNPSITI